MVVMVVGAVFAAVISVLFLRKIKARRGDIIANIVLVVLALICSIAGLADRHYVKVMSERYDIEGGEFLEEYDYCGMEGDHYIFRKSVFMSAEEKYAANRYKLKLPLISRIYKPVRFICLKGCSFSGERVQPVEEGRFYDEINYNSIVKVMPQPQAAVLAGYICAILGLVVYDLSRLFLMGFKNGMDAYDEHRGKDKVVL